MNKNQAITVAIGAGTIGTILAFLGFSYYKNHVEREEPSTDDVGKEANVETSTKEESADKVETDSGVGCVVKSGSGSSISKKEAWGQFWKGAYEDKSLTDENPLENIKTSVNTVIQSKNETQEKEPQQTEAV